MEQTLPSVLLCLGKQAGVQAVVCLPHLVEGPHDADGSLPCRPQGQPDPLGDCFRVHRHYTEAPADQFRQSTGVHGPGRCGRHGEEYPGKGDRRPEDIRAVLVGHNADHKGDLLPGEILPQAVCQLCRAVWVMSAVHDDPGIPPQQGEASGPGYAGQSPADSLFRDAKSPGVQYIHRVQRRSGIPALVTAQQPQSDAPPLPVVQHLAVPAAARRADLLCDHQRYAQAPARLPDHLLRLRLLTAEDGGAAGLEDAALLPARAFHYPKPKKVSANVLKPAEVEDYLDAAERLGHLPMFLLALTAGLRQGELIALKWSDLDIKERTLTITEKRAVERRELVEYEGSTRTVSLTTEAVELLRLEHAKHPGSPLMFMHPATQRPYSPQMVRRLHNEIIQEAGLDHIRFVDLRHTCAVLSLQNGMDAKVVSQMLGHFRIAMTRQNYAPYLTHTADKSKDKPKEASTEDLREAANILDSLLKF